MLYIRPNANRANNAIVLQAISIGVSIVFIASLVWQYIILQDLSQHPDNYNVVTVSTNDIIQQVITIVRLIVIITGFILFLCWFRRAYYNLHQIPGAQVSYTDGWAVGSFFIPFMNLVRPYKIMKEIWEGTQNAITHRLERILPVSFVGVWWAFYLVDSLYGYISSKVDSAALDVESLITSTQLNILGELISIPTAILTIQLIKRVRVFENEMWEEAQTPSESVFSLVPENQPEA